MSEMVKVQVAANGRMVVPKAIRNALGLKDAGTIIMSVDDGQVHITSMAMRIAQAQAHYRAHVVNDLSSDDFLAERRREALEDDLKDLLEDDVQDLAD
jgi:AbrB family looped-hinge helix DNA binding protein